MPKSRVFEGAVERLEILDPAGTCDEALKPDLPDERVREIYRLMVTTRVLDEKSVRLQRQGLLGTYPPVLGQEATEVVPAMCLTDDDWLFPSYRGLGAYMARGVSPTDFLRYWAGDPGWSRIPEGKNVMCFAIPVGTQIPQAAGVAWGLKFQGKKAAALCFLGDGATSKADFHEGLNFAGVLRLPVVFLCENNQYAISAPRSRQTVSKTIAQKALAYGFPGIQVDGNDAFAVHVAIDEALGRARSGGGATLVECETYRLGAHTTADDPSRYRPAAEEETWRRRDPISRLRLYMERTGIWDGVRERALQAEADEAMGRLAAEIESLPAADPGEMFRLAFAEPTSPLLEQRAEFERYAGGAAAAADEHRFP